jgi:hypothetical protein
MMKGGYKKMRFNIRKIASVLASGAMMASTIGFAAAASYPAPFVVGGDANGAVIVGANAAATDWAAAVEISSDLSRRVTADATTSTVSGGAAKSLASGSDLVYLNDDLAENVQTITDSDLPTMLKDETFTDDAGTDFDYEQTVVLGTKTNNGLAYGDSGNDLDEPVVHVAMTDNTANPVFNLSISFDKATDLAHATNSEGEEITFFGRTYTIGTATTNTSLVLLGGAAETTINVGESTTVEVSGESYEVTLNAISDATTAQASISVNGVTKNFAEGNTKKLSGIDVFADTVFRSGDNQGYIVVQLGSDKLTLETGSAVTQGSDNDDIEGTLVTFTGRVNNLTALSFTIVASDSEVDHILQGESFVDPIFGSISLDFVDLKNGPEFTGTKAYVDMSPTRKLLQVTKEGDRELGLKVEIPGQGPVTIPFEYQGRLADDDNDTIRVVEGQVLVDEDYFFLNSGNYQHMMRLTKVSLSESSKSDVHFKDVITGKTYTDLVNNNIDINETAKTTTTFVIDGQTFTMESVNASAVRIYSSDFTGAGKLGNYSSAGTVSVFPYIELLDGKDTRFAFVDDVTIINARSGIILDLPTGTLTIANVSAANATAQKVGGIAYSINVTTQNDTNANLTISVTSNANLSAGGTKETVTGILFVEEEDKTEDTTTTKNVVWIGANSSTTYSQTEIPAFSGTSAGGNFDTDTYDDADFTGYLTNFGTYVLRDKSDSNQDVAGLTYSANQMYAELFISEVGSSITPGSSGSGGQVNVVKDTEVTSVSGLNLFVVGGSCVNAVAAKMLDSDTPLCGAEWTAQTSAGSGQYIIKSMASPYNAAKTAVLVAGYNAADTKNAVGKAKEGVVTDIGKSDVYPLASA